MKPTLSAYPTRRTGLGLVPAADRKVSRLPAEYLGLVPAPADENITVKPGIPDVERDTMPLIIEKAKRTAWQTKKLSIRLKGKNLAETLKNDSNFILKYIRYVKDSPDHEQVRSPRRLIHEGKGDCDCFAVTLATLLINQGITFRFRIAQYAGQDQWSHIYIVVPKDQNNSKSLTIRQDYTVLDPVTNLHDYEVDFAKKRDYNMSLQYLDGFSRRRSTLGECPAKTVATPGAAASSVTIPVTERQKPIDFATNQDLSSLSLQSTTDVLEAAGIPYQHNVDENNNPTVIVATPKGPVELPTVLDNNTASLLTSLTSDPQVSTGQPNSATTIESIVPSKLGYILGAGAFLGLLAWAFSGSKKPGKLSGPPVTARKKVNVLHI